MSRLQLVLASASAELKLHVRNLGFWALIVSWLLAVVFLAPRYSESPAWALDRVSFVLMPMLATVFAVYAAQAASRDRREGTVETMDALPAAYSARAWGRLLGLAAVAGLIALGPLAVTVWRSGLGLVQPSVLLYWAMAYAANLGFALAAGFLAGSLIGNPFLAYPLAAGGWIGWMMLFVALVQSKPAFAWAWVLSPFDPSQRWHDTNLLWGTFPTGGLAFPHYALDVALASAVAALAVLCLKRARDRDYVRHGTLCVLIISLAAGGGSLGTFLANDRMMKESHALQVSLLRETPDPEGWSLGSVDFGGLAAGFGVALYSGTLELGPGRAMHMALDLALDVPEGLLSPGPDGAGGLEFTLNGVFSVTSCKAGPSPERLEDCGFSRQGHSLIVSIPAAGGQAWPATGTAARRVVVHLEYGAEVWSWIEDISGDMQLVACVNPAGTLLPAGFAWYPLPGRWPLGRLMGHGLDSVATGSLNQDPRYWTIYFYDLPLPDSRWSLTVSQLWPGRGGGRPTQEVVLGVVPPAGDGAPSGSPSGSRHFAGLAQRGCFLIGAPEVSAVEAGNVKLICAPSLAAHAGRLADHLARTLDFLGNAGIDFGPLFMAGIVPVGGIPGITEEVQLGGSLNINEGEALFESQALEVRDPQRLTRHGSLSWALLERAVFNSDTVEMQQPHTPGIEQAEAFWGAYYVGEAFKAFLGALTLEELCGEECYVPALESSWPRFRQVAVDGQLIHPDAFDNALALLDGFHGRHGTGPSVQLCRALLDGVRNLELSPDGFAERVAGFERALTGGRSE